MSSPETSTEASQQSVNPDLQTIQQAMNSFNLGAPRSGLPPFAPFNPHQDRSTVGQRWRKWLKRFQNLLISLREFDSKVKRGLLLTYVGDATNDIFDTLPETGEDYETAVLKLNEYFDPISNTDMAIFEFREMKQMQGEAINAFYRRLKEKAASCEFSDEDREIKTHIIHKTTDSRLRRKALREKMTLQQLLTYGNTLEKTDLDSKKIETTQRNETTSNNAFALRNQRFQQPPYRPRGRNQQRNSSGTHPSSHKQCQCRNCGGQFPHEGGKTKCPAYGKTCHQCGKSGHFAKHCLSKPVKQPQKNSTPKDKQTEIRYVNEPSSEEDSDEAFIFSLTNSKQQPEVTVHVENIPVKLVIDSGSSVNLINSEIFRQVQEVNPSIKLSPCTTKVFPYGSTKPIALNGQFNVTISHKQRETKATFHVTKSPTRCLLSYITSSELGILTLNVNKLTTTDNHKPEIQALLQNHQPLFEGTGHLKNCEIKLEIDESVTPVAQSARRIPHSMKQIVNKKLKEMRRQGIIERVKGATPWLSPLVVIPKKCGDVRLVVDMRKANTALKRRRIQIPTVNEILQKMQGATVFTELDLSQGYLQLSLAPESRSITAFPTPEDGPHQFTRLVMGACPSGEYFHEKIHELLRGIPNCENISDNIWLWSKDMPTHLKHLEMLFNTLQVNGLTLKLPKCTFAQSEINVFGHIVSANGIRPDPRKIEAITQAPHPKCASEVRSFLGLTNYCSRYIPHYSTITQPLRQLTKSNVTFEWNEPQEEAFQKLKKIISTVPVLAHYDLHAPTKIVVDASPWALGAILLQQQSDTNYRPVAYGSRSLTSTEVKYGHIEKEALAIVHGCEHFHMYLYGRKFELETDHKPLEYIFQPKARNSKPPPARIERWQLRLQEYDFEVVYRPGSQNLADSLSRLTPQQPTPKGINCAERYVNLLAQHMTPRAIDTEEIRSASVTDPELEHIRKCVTNNKLYNLHNPFKAIADELCVANDIVLRGNRIVVPQALRTRVITIAHEDHAGITRCKQRLRSKLWWPGMDQDVETFIKCCHPCQVTSQPNQPTPIQSTPLPSKPWDYLALDICGPFPTGEYALVLIDYYSRWTEVEIVTTTTSARILKWLDTVFATHGYPNTLQTDNASYFTSAEFTNTLKAWGIKPRTVTEYWPQANGLVERFNKVLLKFILTSLAEGRNWKESIPTMLRNYRSTQHGTTGKSPALLLMNRELRTKIPSIEQKPENRVTADIEKTDAASKQKSKSYADNKRRATPHHFKIGDKVLLRQPHSNKFSTTFHHDPVEIIKVNGSQIVMRSKTGQLFRRNASHVKQFNNPNKPPSEDNHEDEDSNVTPNANPNGNTPPPLPPPQVPPQASPPALPRRSTRYRKPPDYFTNLN